MNEEKKTVEGEMGSGDSDDEFYNVKLSSTLTASVCKSAEKIESALACKSPREKVTYNYVFESSSDDDYEKKIDDVDDNNGEPDSGNKKRDLKLRDNQEKQSINIGKLPEKTCKIVKKINEELKNMKKIVSEVVSDKTNESHPGHLFEDASADCSKWSQISAVPPAWMVPPLAVHQTPLVNAGSMMVPSHIGIGQQNVMPGHVSRNNLRESATVGGIISSPDCTIPNSMTALNSARNHTAPVVGICNSKVLEQTNLLGLHGNMVNPTMIGGSEHNSMVKLGSAAEHGGFTLPRSGVCQMGVPGVSEPKRNIAGVAESMNSSAPSSNITKSEIEANSGGLTVDPGHVMSNIDGSMVIGNAGSSSSNTSDQASAIPDPLNVNTCDGVFGMSRIPSLPPLPASFTNVRNRPPLPSPSPGNYKWQSTTNLLEKTPGLNMSPASFFRKTLPAGTQSPGAKEKYCYKGEGEKEIQAIESAAAKKKEFRLGPASPPRKDLPNTFKNDGSFLEIFKRMNNEKNQETSSGNEGAGSAGKSSTVKKTPVSFNGMVGKRRGGRVLKTGLVKKVRKESDSDELKHPKDAWSIYMAEVKKYKEASCEEEGKTRPLVK